MRKLFFPLFVLVFIFDSSFGQKNLHLLGSLHFSGQSLSGCWHYNHIDGSEYALVGASNGIAIVNITNPASPSLVFQVPGVNSKWHEVKVQGDFAYAVSEGYDSTGRLNGLQIIDLRYLPDSAPNKFYTGDGVILNMLEKAHSITAAGKHVFVNGHNITSLGRGVLILNISDPWFPVYEGAVTSRYCHDSFVRGDTIYTSDILDGLFSIYNISNPAVPVILATQVTPGTFNHNTWLSDDSRTLFAADERAGAPLASFDVSDLNNISLLDTFFNGNFSSNEVHNVRVFNDYLINPSYGSQLTIADASRPDNMIETGSYTTGNSLCWDADPYPISGNIIATDMNAGMLFVFSPNYIRACYLEGLVTDSVTGFPIIGATLDFPVAGIVKTSDLLGMYKTGYADSGTYTISCSKSGYITKSISAVLQNGVLTVKNFRLVPIGAEIDEANSDGIQISPNPSDSYVRIQTFKSPIDSWKIIDAQGRIVKMKNSSIVKNGDLIINMNDLTPGVYIFNFKSDNQNFQRKIVKK